MFSSRRTSIKTICQGIIVAIMTWTSISSANEFAGFIGGKFNNATAATAGTTVSGKTGFQGGLVAYIDMASEFGFRTGFSYMQRNYSLKAGTLETDLSYGFFEIPATVYFKAGDLVSIFGGVGISIRTSQECKVSGGSCTFTKDASSTLIPFQVGATVKFGNGFGGEFYYEMASGEMHENILKDVNSVNVNLAYFFD